MKNIFKITIILVLFIIKNACADSFEESDQNVIDNTNLYKPNQHPHGIPINALSFTSDFNITVDYENLGKLFLHPAVKDRKAVTISIIGAFRKGKSFIMDYFLRYMYAKFQSVNNMEEKQRRGSWLGKPSDPLTGFSWKTGSDRHTSGIVFWSDVFLYDYPNGDKIAIFLIDTQGLFDTQTPLQENIKIFGIGTLISSLQIFNLNDVIQEDQLQYLQMATDYARYAVAENKAKGIKGIKAFQNLLFLMRDWRNVEDYGYGLDEGHRYLMDVLQIEEHQKQVLQEVRLYIQSSFEKVFCFLMPHPGLKVINNKKYDGRYSEMDVDFRNELSNLVLWLFNPKNLKPKKVFNEELTAKKLYHYMCSYFEVFQLDAPEVESIYGATVNSQLKGMVDTSLTEFQNQISQTVDINNFESMTNIDNYYASIKNEVLDMFKGQRKMGNAYDEEKYLKILSLKIDEFYNDFKAHAVNHYNLYIESMQRAEQEKIIFEEELNNIIHANRSQMAEEIEKLQQEHKNKELELAQKRENLEISKNDLLQKIKNEHSLTQEEIEIANNAVHKAYQLSIQQFEFEEENKVAIYQQHLHEKQMEMQIREQALAEKESKILEALQKQEEISKQQWEREQAAKIEQLKFEQMMEEQRFQREQIMFEKQKEQDQQKYQFDREMEIERNKNREKMMEYQLKLEEIKEKGSQNQHIIDMENSKQKQQMQLQVLHYQTQQQQAIEAAKIAKAGQAQGMFGQIMQTAVQLAPLAMIGSGKPIMSPQFPTGLHSAYPMNNNFGSMSYNPSINNGLGTFPLNPGYNSYNSMSHASPINNGFGTPTLNPSYNSHNSMYNDPINNVIGTPINTNMMGSTNAQINSLNSLSNTHSVNNGLGTSIDYGSHSSNGMTNNFDY